MKICHVVPYAYPAWAYGGTPRVVWELACAQTKQGHQVTILTTDAFQKNERTALLTEKVLGIQIVRLRNLSNFLSWNFHFVTPFHLPPFLKTENFAVLHLHEVRSVIHLLALNQLQYKTVILSPWGTLPYNDSLVFFKKILDLLFLPVMRRKVELGLGQTRHEVGVLKKFALALKTAILPLSISAGEFSTLPTKSAARKKLHLQQDTFVFCFLGRFSQAKGVVLLIEAFASSFRHSKSCTLLLVGRDDGALAMIENKIAELNLKNNVIIHPALYERERLLAYRAADCFVTTPLVYEETATTTLEALACETPVITTHQAQVPFFTPNDGVVHVTADPISVSRALTAVFTLHQIQKPLTADKKKLIAHFDSKKVCAKVLQHYDSLS